VNIRNLTLFGILTVLAAVSHSYCMINIVNKTIQKFGTFTSYSLATGPLVLNGIIEGYITHTYPELGCDNTVIMSPAHQQFYRKTIIKDPKIQLRTTKVNNDAYRCGSIIVMPEVIDTPKGTISLDTAINQNDEPSLSAFKGICEHELRHYENGDNYQRATEYIITPIATTTITGIALKKIVPVSKTFAQHVGRCIGKISAGVYGFHVNKKITEHVVSYRSRRREYRADQGVSLENRKSFINTLTVASNNAIKANVKQQYPNLSDAQRNILAQKIEDKHYKSPLASHPAPRDRAAALFPIQSKKS
jgi:Zn-dependent protease with chaperone function